MSVLQRGDRLVVSERAACGQRGGRPAARWGHLAGRWIWRAGPGDGGTPGRLSIGLRGGGRRVRTRMLLPRFGGRPGVDGVARGGPPMDEDERAVPAERPLLPRGTDAWLDGRALEDATLAAYLAELHDQGRAAGEGLDGGGRGVLPGPPRRPSEPGRGNGRARVLAGYRRTAGDRRPGAGAALPRGRPCRPPCRQPRGRGRAASSPTPSPSSAARLDAVDDSPLDRLSDCRRNERVPSTPAFRRQFCVPPGWVPLGSTPQGRRWSLYNSCLNREEFPRLKKG